MHFLVEDFFSLEYDDETECVTFVWKEPVFSAEFRRINRLFLSFIGDRPIRRMIRDTRKMSIIGVEDQKWFAEEIAPHLFAKGLKYAAIIQSDTEIGKMTTRDISKRLVPGTIETRFFDTMSEAREWMALTGE